MAASGRFVLRIEPELHEALRAAAAGAGVSLNEWCARTLSLPGTQPVGAADEVVQRAVEIFGVELRGVLVYGSWARNQLTDASDVDVLLVVSAGVELTRRWYREWDVRPIEWEGHRVEPHVVHLPAAEDRLTGLWAEVALDGVVLFDPGLELSRRLVTLRERIIAGELVPRTVHGERYWVEAA